MEFLAVNHPKVVHFAISLLFLYCGLEIFGVIFKKNFISKTAHLILLFGVLAATGATITGNQALEIARIWEEEGSIIQFGAISKHEYYATITLWFFAGVLVLRTIFVLKKKFTGYFQYIFVVLALAGIYFVYETGEHGGELVYKYGIGTEYKKNMMEYE
jgi:uncharacterized membrane protein